jgi:rhodanese-related sulfurtransferase
MAEHSRTHRWLAVLAGALGVLAVAAGEPYPAERGPTAPHNLSFVSALDVARWIRTGQQELRLVDVRDVSLFDAYHIPGAELIALDELSRQVWPREANVVLYASDDAQAARAATILWTRGVAHAQVLRGGLHSWLDAIVEPRLTPLAVTATPEERAARREQVELSRYFGGMPVVSPSAAPRVTRRPPSEAAAVARIIRRGC